MKLEKLSSQELTDYARAYKGSLIMEACLVELLQRDQSWWVSPSYKEPWRRKRNPHAGVQTIFSYAL